MSLINTMLKELEKTPRENVDGKMGVQPSLSEATLGVGRSQSLRVMMRFSWVIFSAGLLIAAIHVLKHVTWPHHSAATQQTVVPAIAAAPTNIKTNSVLNETEIAEDYYQKAAIEMKNNDISRAMVDLSEAIKKNPQLQQAREALVVLLIQEKKITAALEAVNDGLIVSPAYLPFVKLKAHILVELEKYRDALDLLSENAPAIDQDPDYYALMAAIYEKDKSYMVAARLYHQLTEIRSDVGEWWFGLGASLQMAGKRNAATEAYQKALETGNLNPEVRSYIETQIQENA